MIKDYHSFVKKEEKERELTHEMINEDSLLIVTFNGTIQYIDLILKSTGTETKTKK